MLTLTVAGRISAPQQAPKVGREVRSDQGLIRVKIFSTRIESLGHDVSK